MFIPTHIIVVSSVVMHPGEVCLYDLAIVHDLRLIPPQATWPTSNKCSAYWVGVAENIGDNLTYWIHNDQMMCLLAGSVVCAFSHNYNVK
jgi:hypothetical protein